MLLGARGRGEAAAVVTRSEEATALALGVLQVRRGRVEQFLEAGGSEGWFELDGPVERAVQE